MVPDRRPSGVAVVGLLIAGCSGTAAPTPEAVTPERASEQVTFGTLQDIGAFTFEYSTRDARTASGTTTVREAAGSLKWKDRDHWEYTTVLDGAPATRWLVADARAYQALSGGPLRLKGDPEPLREQLALGWDPWDDVVAITGGRITYGPGVPETLDGRDAMRHTLAQAGWQALIAKSGRMFDGLAREFLLALHERRGAGGGGAHVEHLIARLDLNGFYAAAPPPARA